MYKYLFLILFGGIPLFSNAIDKKNENKPKITYRVNGKVVSQKKFDENTKKEHRKIVQEYPNLFEKIKKL